MEPEVDVLDAELSQILYAADTVGQWAGQLHSPQEEEEEEHLSDSYLYEVEAEPVVEMPTITSSSGPHASSNTAAQHAAAPHSLALALAILNNPALQAKLRELVAAAQDQPQAPQAPVLFDCKDCGKRFKTSQGLGGHRKHCKGSTTTTPRAPALQSSKAEGATARSHSFVNEHGLVMHISFVEGHTFQWTASIADDRLQFYTQHHLSGPCSGDVFKRVRKLCMLDAEKAFPGQHIKFTTSEKRREMSPWRPLEDAAKKVVQDNAVAFLTEAFKQGLALRK